MEESEILRSEDPSESDARLLLATLDSWASVASNAVGWVYAPTSPWFRDMAGWIRDVPAKLYEIAEKIRDALLIVAHKLGVNS